MLELLCWPPEHHAAKDGVQSIYLYQLKKDWTRSRTALSLLLSDLSHGGLALKRAEQAASGRHLCSTDLVFRDDCREMLEHMGQREEGATLCSALRVAQAHSWRVSAGADPFWHDTIQLQLTVHAGRGT